MDEILQLAKAHNIHVIEDNAQAIGASYKGKKTGSFGIMNLAAFTPPKTSEPLATAVSLPLILSSWQKKAFRLETMANLRKVRLWIGV